MIACVIRILHFVTKNILHTVNSYGCNKSINLQVDHSLTDHTDANRPFGRLKLVSHRVVAVEGTDHDTLWYFHEVRNVVVISFNSHNTTLASRHIFTCHKTLRLFTNRHNTKFRVVAVSLMPQHFVVVLSAQLACSTFELDMYTFLQMWPRAAKYSLEGHGLRTHDLNSLACSYGPPDLS